MEPFIVMYLVGMVIWFVTYMFIRTISLDDMERYGANKVKHAQWALLANHRIKLTPIWLPAAAFYLFRLIVGKGGVTNKIDKARQYMEDCK